MTINYYYSEHLIAYNSHQMRLTTQKIKTKLCQSFEDLYVGNLLPLELVSPILYHEPVHKLSDFSTVSVQFLKFVRRSINIPVFHQLNKREREGEREREREREGERERERGRELVL